MVGIGTLVFASMFQVFVCVFSTEALNAPKRGSPEELKEALNTTGKIWLDKRRTNKTSSNTCLYWQKKSFFGDVYEFTESYWDGSQPRQEHLNGTISSKPESGEEGAALKVVGRSEEGTDLEYLLVHWEREAHCAIFYTQIKNPEGKRHSQTCGIYYWDANVEKQEFRQKCQQHFDTYCLPYGKDDQVLYNASCQSLLGC
uniref:Lipocalin n=1 Tax=Rhipicephalus appendiculatus TaxID=34631 RepID=A0A131Z3T4_RHIAP